MFSKSFSIGARLVGDSAPCYIIAEAGVNHGGDLDLALKMIDVAVEAGADAIKFQSFKAGSLILKDVGLAPYQERALSKGISQYEMLENLEMSIEMAASLQRACKAKNIEFLTTPFDAESLDEISRLELGAYKIASTDLTNPHFIQKVAGLKAPVILSTGMSYDSEVDIAVSAVKKESSELVLLQCASNYPVPINEVNLSVMTAFTNKYGCVVGYSDHTLGMEAPMAAVAIGAKVIEKHFTLDRTFEGPDHAASLEPEELVTMIRQIRTVEQMIGTPVKYPSTSESLTRLSLQKSIVAKSNIEKGEVFSDANLTAKRTGGRGLSAIYMNDLLGKRSMKSYSKDEIIEL